MIKIKTNVIYELNMENVYLTISIAIFIAASKFY